jgi:hypothetical protein
MRISLQIGDRVIRKADPTGEIGRVTSCAVLDGDFLIGVTYEYVNGCAAWVLDDEDKFERLIAQ